MKSQKKISKVMREFKAGTLNTGSKKGPIVKNPKQAIAIALSQAGKSKPRRYADGGEVAAPPVGTADFSGGPSQQTAGNVAAAQPQQETSSPYYSPNEYGKSATGANPAMGGLNVQDRMTGAGSMAQGYAKGGMVKKKPMMMKKGGGVLCRGGGMVMRSRPTKVC